MKIKSILLTFLIVLIGVATTVTTWAKCPGGYRRYNPLFYNKPYNYTISRLKGRTIFISDHKIVISSNIGFVTI